MSVPYSGGAKPGYYPSISPSQSTEQRREKSMRPISEYFGELTFGLGHMRERLPRDVYADLLRSLEYEHRVRAYHCFLQHRINPSFFLNGLSQFHEDNASSWAVFKS